MDKRTENPELNFEEETDPIELEKSHKESEAFMREAKEARVRLKKAMKEVVWKVMDTIIDELTHNEDIIETTARKCIVGYIIKRLKENNLLA